MDFYVSWYPGDPIYPQYDDDCALLVSITSVAQDWTLSNLPVPPKRLLIDSGGYRFAVAPQEALSPKQILARQLKLLAHHPIPTIICARDYPILNKNINSNQRDTSISQTIAFAYEFKALFVQQKLAPNIIPMAIIQGNDPDSIAYCTYELKQIGFPLYGLGSLAELRHHKLIMKRIKIVIDIIGVDKLHIFGVSAIKTIRKLRELGIHSFDSSRPAKAAAYNEILYSNPYRRFGIYEGPNTPMFGSIPRSRRLQKPLPCTCPTCIDNTQNVLGVGKRKYIRGRALHNYYHLKRTFFS